MPCVTVIIPNWNGAHLLRDICLPSLASQTFRDFTVIVVDNGSTDGSADYLARAWPEVNVIRLSRNLGFSVAVNRGIEVAASDLIALINTDIELEREWLAELVGALDQHPDAGSVTGKILQYHDRTVISAAGDIVTRDAVCASRGQEERDDGQYDLAEPVFSGTGAASVYRGSAFKMVGVFDEDFYAYLEDVDWGFRAQLHGLSCWYIPEARAYHLRGATQRRVSGLLTYLLIRNTLWLVTKNFPGFVLRRRFLRLILLPTLRSYRGIRDGGGRLVAKAWFEAFLGLPKMLRKRAAIQAGRTLHDEEIEGLFSPGSLGSPRLRRLKDRVSLRARGAGFSWWSGPPSL